MNRGAVVSAYYRGVDNGGTGTKTVCAALVARGERFA